MELACNESAVASNRIPRGVTMKRFQPTLEFWVKKNKVSSEPNDKSNGSVQSIIIIVLDSILYYMHNRSRTIYSI